MYCTFDPYCLYANLYTIARWLQFVSIEVGSLQVNHTFWRVIIAILDYTYYRDCFTGTCSQEETDDHAGQLPPIGSMPTNRGGNNNKRNSSNTNARSYQMNYNYNAKVKPNRQAAPQPSGGRSIHRASNPGGGIMAKFKSSHSAVSKKYVSPYSQRSIHTFGIGKEWCAIRNIACFITWTTCLSSITTGRKWVNWIWSLDY